MRDFLRTHPVSDQTHTILVTRLAEGLTRANALAVEEQTGRLAARAANTHRLALRREAQRELVRYVERVGKVAAHERPDLVGRFRGPAPNASNAAFLARAWDLLNLARANQELLAGHGLAGTQLDTLASVLTRYEEATEQANGSRATHVGAAAALESITSALTEVVGVLDVLNQSRFREDAQLLAAWRSAKRLAHPRRRGGTTPTPIPTPAPSPDGIANTPDLGRAA